MGRGREEGKAGWGIGQTPRHFLRPGWPGTARLRLPLAWTQQPGSRLLLSFLLWRAPLPLAGRSGCESKTIGRGRGSLRARPWGSPHPAAYPRALRGSTSHAPEGLKRRAGSSPAAASPPGSVTLLPFPVTQVRKTLKVATCGATRRTPEPGPGRVEEGCAETRRPALTSPPRHRSAGRRRGAAWGLFSGGGPRASGALMEKA